MLTQDDITAAQDIATATPEQATALDRLITHAQRAFLPATLTAQTALNQLRTRTTRDPIQMSEDQAIADAFQATISRVGELEAQVEELSAP